MKKRDIVLIALLLAVALALYFGAQLLGADEVSSVVVTIDGAEVLRKPLDVNDSYEIRQDDGSVNVITVENGAVYMKEANCRDGLCLRQGRLRNQAGTIVCLPHEVVVKLTGGVQEADDGLDVIIQ